MQEIYEIPGSIQELFENKENSYRIVNYSKDMEMDNIQSMAHFLECVGVKEENIQVDDGTQVTLVHSSYNYKLVIDSGGLGDFFSHGFDVSLYEN